MKDQGRDGNEDDLIDLIEFRRLMEDTFRPLKIQVTEEMVKWNFAQIDKDNSGRISFDEYLKFIKKYNSWDVSYDRFVSSNLSTLFWCLSLPKGIFLAYE